MNRPVHSPPARRPQARWIFVLSVWVCALSTGGAAPAQAASSVTSSALDSLSASVGVASGALSGSVSSVSPGKAQVAQGPYRIAALQRPADAPQWVWLDLQPAQPPAGGVGPVHPAPGRAAAQTDGPGLMPEPWRLRLPAALADTAGLDTGQVLTVQTRPYGLGVWAQAGGVPLYLVLHDDWAQAMAVRPLDGDGERAAAR